MITAFVIAAGMHASACATGQSAPRPSPTGPEMPIAIGQVAAVTLAAGAATEVVIPVTVGFGFHVQANPASNQFLVPLELQLAPVTGFAFGDPVYPQGRPYRLEGADDELSTYEGTIEIRLPLTATAAAPPGEHVVEGLVHYQACDTRTCLFPSSVPVSIVVEVAPRRPPR